MDTELIKTKIRELNDLLQDQEVEDVQLPCGEMLCENCPFECDDDRDDETTCGLGNIVNTITDLKFIRMEMLITPHNCPLEQEEADMEELAMFDIEMNRPKKIPDKINAKILGVIKSYSSIIDLTESKEVIHLGADLVSVFKEEAEK